MAGIRFNQAFFGLMLLSLCSAFIFPSRLTDLGRTQFATLLYPISRPSYHLANAVRGHFVQAPVEDTRPEQTIVRENLALKQQVQRMSGEISRLEQRAGERESLGGFESLCERFEVISADSDNREGLNIGGSLLTDVRAGQPVLATGTVVDLIGRINRAGALSAHVLLVTDAGFTVTGHFVSYSGANGAQENKNLLAIVRGKGEGEMIIDKLPLKDVMEGGVQVGDWVVLSDDAWPAALQGVRIGRVASILPLPKQSLFAEIELAPEPNLLHPNDVWVMTHQP